MSKRSTFEGGGLSEGEGGSRFKTTAEADLQTVIETQEQVLQEAGMVSLEKAREIMGSHMYGPEEVERVFGMDSDAPPIPFTEAELQRAHMLGQELILQADSYFPKSIGAKKRKLTIAELKKYIQFFSEPKSARRTLKTAVKEVFSPLQTPRPGWRLVTPELVHVGGRTNLDYLTSVAALVDYFRNTVHQGNSPPEPYASAIVEYNALVDESRANQGGDLWLSHALRTARIIPLLMEAPVEALYRYVLYRQLDGDREPAFTIWTSEIVPPASTDSYPFAKEFGCSGRNVAGVMERSMENHVGIGVAFSQLGNPGRSPVS